jgi:hypothetical protein
MQGTIQQQKSDLDRDREQQMTLVNNQREELYEMQQAIDRQKVCLLLLCWSFMLLNNQEI